MGKVKWGVGGSVGRVGSVCGGGECLIAAGGGSGGETGE